MAKSNLRFCCMLQFQQNNLTSLSLFKKNKFTQKKQVASSQINQNLLMRIVCSLLLLSIRSCPYLSFPVSNLTLFMTSATEYHLQLAYSVLKYLKNTNILSFVVILVLTFSPICYCGLILCFLMSIGN